MELTEYFTAFPDAEIYRQTSFGDSTPGSYLGCDLLFSSLLHFDDTSACYLAGPFPGNYGGIYIWDFRKSPELLLRLDRYHQGLLESWQKLSQEKSRRGKKARGIGPPVHNNPSTALPIQVYIFGNDDTTYSKFYETPEKALEEVQLLKASEPLNMHDLWSLGFTDTN